VLQSINLLFRNGLWLYRVSLNVYYNYYGKAITDVAFIVEGRVFYALNNGMSVKATIKNNRAT
jgi:hypothetical protein